MTNDDDTGFVAEIEIFEELRKAVERAYRERDEARRERDELRARLQKALADLTSLTNV